MNHHKRFVSSGPLAWVWQGSVLMLGGAALAAGVTLSTPAPATAQAAYGSYIGAGAAFGVTDGDSGEPSRTSAVVAFRYKFLKLPISVRTQAMIGDRVAIIPTVSYDIPLSWRADAYIGAGAAIALDDDKTTPVGNKTSFAIQPGIDYALPNSQLMIFGNAVIAFDAYRKGGGTAASLQAGVGLRF